MRKKIFDWIDQTFGELCGRGVVNYSENRGVRFFDDVDRIDSVNETNFIVVVADAPTELLDAKIHARWKAELEAIANLGEYDRFNFEAELSQHLKIPSFAEAANGVPESGLIRLRKLRVTANFYRRRPA